MATRIVRDYYKTLIIGASGQGKTYGFRNLDGPKTYFINVENKPLPFAKVFGKHARPKKWAGVIQALKDVDDLLKFPENAKFDLVVLDSLSAAVDIMLEECRANFSGWDIWNAYNKNIGELAALIKKIEREVVITAHYEILNIEGAPEKRLKLKGKEWEGVFEKEFTIVLYSEAKYKGGKPEKYIYKLAAEGASAKCPPAIMGEGVYDIENDYNAFHEKVLAFALQSSTTTDQPSASQVEQAIFS